MTLTKHTPFRLAFLSCLITAQLAGNPSWAENADRFNPALLEIDNPNNVSADLSLFEKGVQAPGIYHVDIIINGELIDTKDIEFRSSGENQELQPCISLSQLAQYNVKTELFPELAAADNCVNIATIPQASAEFNFNTQRLILSIPQAGMKQATRGYVPPEKWDNGINALLLNYSFNGDYSQNKNNESINRSKNSYYLNLRPGINIGPWRLRNYTTWNRNSSGDDSWKTIYTYAQRSIAPLKGQLIIGDSNSSTDIFEGVPFRGARLSSDDEMLPDSLKGYAPVVRGVAKTNAKIVIRQNNYTIYQTYVTPGAFEVTDMYPTGGSGDLDVTIEESDGTQQHFIVPFASLPIFQREGRLKYDITAGQYRPNDSGVKKHSLIQATGILGLPWQFTTYGGLQYSDKYNSFAVGLGKNIGILGAISADFTQAHSNFENKPEKKGHSYHLRYSKSIAKTGTTFSASGYRYSEDYYSMPEVLSSWRESGNYDLTDRKKSRLELILNQRLSSKFGSISASYFDEKYWKENSKSNTLNVSYNNSWQGINYSLSAMRNNRTYQSGLSEKNNIFFFNMSIPLSRWTSRSWLTYGLTSQDNGNTTHSLSLSGTTLADNNLNWNVQTGYDEKEDQVNGSVNTSYKGTYGEVNLGYGYSQDEHRINYGLQGGVVVHKQGITLGQPVGETFALVSAPGVNGAKVFNRSGIKTDRRGFTLVSYLSPYRKNNVSLDMSSLPDNVELSSSTKTLIPTRGAVVKAGFTTKIGNRVLMTILKQDGKPVPFGSNVTTSQQADESNSSIVGDEGQVYVTGLESRGKLLVSWGKDPDKQCTVNYNLNNVKNSNNIFFVTEKCQ